MVSWQPNADQSFDPKSFLAKVGEGRSIGTYRKDQIVFSQGDPADAVFYIQKGKVKVTVVSEQGKEAVVAILEADEFFGEGCLAGQTQRIATVATMTEFVIMRLEKAAVVRVIHHEPAFSEMFIAHLLGRTIRVEADLVDQLFNSSEKRLARMLLLLANFGKEGKPEPIIAKISQETLAEMIGTTRSRVSFFMNKFRKLGLIRLQRRHRSPQFIVERRSARPAANQDLNVLASSLPNTREASRAESPASVAASGLDLAVENFRIGRTFDMKDSRPVHARAREGVIDQDIVAGHIQLEFRDDGAARRNSDSLHTRKGSLRTPPRL